MIVTVQWQDEKLKDRDIIQHVFTSAEHEIYNCKLACFVFGMLLLLDTKTEDEAIASDSIFTSEKTDSIEKIKIGLVLSGGAAKGLAHIGILKVFEQIGITPDYITGTSIGAVVGSMYAIGYTAEEISEYNRNADWNVLLSDRIPLTKIEYEEKYEYKRFIFGIPIRNYKFKLPSGAIAGQQLEKFFADIMWPLTDNENFDSLPIPFHCMSVDLISGQTITKTNTPSNPAKL